MGVLLYNCFLFLYLAGAWAISPWNQKAKLWLRGRKNIFPALYREFAVKKQPLVWMHCASLGEFEQGRPLLEAIKSRYPTYRILLTFFSPSGYEIRKNYDGADFITYLPMDSDVNASRFLDLIKPDLVLWVKYEYWYYYLTAIKKRNIPLLLISGIFREDQPFFKWYGGLYRKMLLSFTHFFVQNTDSQKRLADAGFSPQVTISGDTRFDRVIDIAEKFEPIQPIEDFCKGHAVIVAGSTWPEDEEELDHYANTHPEIRFIIAPHEISEGHIKDVERLFHNSIRYSKLTGAAPDQEGRVLIIDNIGILSRLYKYATITYVGGGFGDSGLHNVLEAAVYGKPVVFGPVYEKFIEAAELVEQEGALSVENALELEEELNLLLNDEAHYNKTCKAAHDYVYAKHGATRHIMEYIQEKRLLTN